jgi:hypothetical protein
MPTFSRLTFHVPANGVFAGSTTPVALSTAAKSIDFPTVSSRGISVWFYAKAAGTKSQPALPPARRSLAGNPERYPCNVEEDGLKNMETNKAISLVGIDDQEEYPSNDACHVSERSGCVGRNS